MVSGIKIVLSDPRGVEREFSKGIKVNMVRDMYLPYVSLTGEFVCDSAISAAQVCAVKLKIGSDVVFSGIPDKVQVQTRRGIRRISFASRSYTSLTAQNEPEPGIISDVNLSSLVSSCFVHPMISVEQNTPVESYIYVKASSSLWQAIVAYNIKKQNRLPYIYGTNTIMSTKANSVQRSYSGERLTNEGFSVNTLNMLSQLHMRIGSDQYQYHYTNPSAADYQIVRTRYYELDYQWLHDIDKGLVYKAANSNRLRNVMFFEYTSFKNEQLYDVVGGTGTACDGRYINRVEFTADAKGVRTCVYCFDDDLGQR